MHANIAEAKEICVDAAAVVVSSELNGLLSKLDDAHS